MSKVEVMVGKPINEWELVTLDAFCEGIRGVTYKPDDLASEQTNETVILLRSNNIQEGVLVFKDVQNVTQDRVSKKQTARPKDIVVCMSNGSKRLVGKSAAFKYIPLGARYTVGSFCSIFRPLKTVDADFVKHIFSSNEFKEQVNISLAGSAINNLKNSDLLSYKFLKPSLSEQQKIATILSSVDNVIEKTRAQIDKLKDLKTGMMQELLTKGIGHTEFKDSPVGRIPISWKAMPLGTVCELEVGYAFKSEWFSDSGVRLLRGDNVGYGIPTWERIQYLAEEQAKSYSRYLLDVDDVVIGMDRTFTQSGAKITKIRSSDVPALLVQRVGKFVPEKYTMKFLWQLVRSPAFIEGLKAQEKGMDIPHLSKNEILSCVVVLPPFKEQEKIASILEAQDNLIKRESAGLVVLEKMKKALLQDLLTGKKCIY